MQFVSLTDKELVKHYIKGNENSFEVLLSRHKDKVFNYIKMMVKDVDVANDIFQDTFIKVIQTLKKGKYNEEGKFLPWVMRIAHNLIIDHFRKAKKMPKANIYASNGEDEDFDIFSILRLDDQNVEDRIVMDQVFRDVKKLLDYLPEEQREVVVMRHYQDMSFKDISEKTGVSINTALGRMRYALINLRRLIEENKMIMTY